MGRLGKAAIRGSHIATTRFPGKTGEVWMWGSLCLLRQTLWRPAPYLSPWRPSQSQPNIKASEEEWCQWPRDLGASSWGMPVASKCAKSMGGEKGQERMCRYYERSLLNCLWGSWQRWVEYSACGAYLSWGSLKLIKYLAQGCTQDWHTIHRTQGEVVLEPSFSSDF